jgi:hypothetical protein
MPFSLKDFADIRAKSAGKSKGKAAAAGLLSPSSPVHSPSGRGRLSRRPGPRPLGAVDARGRTTRSWSGRLSPHAWREPSPDVWSIEEETEEEVVNSEMGNSDTEGRTKAIDIPGAGKVKKRVRFVLPVRETI